MTHSASDGLALLLRLVGAALLGTMGGIHAYLFTQGYSDIPSIGPLFMLSAVASGIAALALLLTPGRYLGVVAVLCSLLVLGTLGGLVVSLTRGLFGFQDTLSAPLATASVWVEGSATILLAFLTWLRLRHGRPVARPRTRAAQA